MSDKKKNLSFKTKFLNIITFGYLKRKATKQIGSYSNDKIKKDFDKEELFHLLGNKENILVSKMVSDNSIKINLKNVNLINIDNLKTFCDATGSMKSNDSITIITKSAKYIYDALNNETTNN